METVVDLRHVSEEQLMNLAKGLEAERFSRRNREVNQYATDASSPVANLGKAAMPGNAWPSVQQGSAITERLTLSNIDDAMKYQPWEREQVDAGDVVREALTLAAKAILRSVPDGAFRSVALRNIIDARMNANAGISFRGRF